MTQKYDIIIAGGSYAGLTQAIAVAQVFQGSARIAVVDPIDQADAAPDQPSDVRASAISAGSQRLLVALGVWPDLQTVAQPVTAIELTDTRLTDVIRPTLLTYDNTIDAGSAATFIVENHHLKMALHAAVKHANKAIEVINSAVAAVSVAPAGASVTLTDGRNLTASLIIAADGKRSRVREAAGIKTVAWTYPQTGIVTTIAHERPHAGRAVQHFLPAGPFASLPLTGNRSCITWSEDAAAATRILALPDAAFLQEIERRIGNRLGQRSLAGGRQSWPLDMHLSRAWMINRIALIGDAAHGVHPIAGQGLNLGFRDVAALTEVIADAASLGLDFGLSTVLERYQRWRRLDCAVSTAAFDGLNTLFSTENTAFRTARSAGLSLVDRLPSLKRYLVTEAAGLSGNVPKLMRGEKL